MIEMIIVKYKNGDVKILKYMIVNGETVVFDEEKGSIDLLPLKEFEGEEIKIVLLKSDDLSNYSGSQVLMTNISSVSEEMIEFEGDDFIESIRKFNIEEE
jgi:hypothetical protein